ncbi:hypothetical protein IFO70_12215 [Phormidium tenue FACHB-886]|nr:hypothetical protein [Phormidium tenue FACHB-886]
MLWDFYCDRRDKFWKNRLQHYVMDGRNSIRAKAGSASPRIPKAGVMAI